MVYQMSEFGHGCTRILLVALNVLCIMTALFIFGFAVVDTRILHQYSEEEEVAGRYEYIGDIACFLLVAQNVTALFFGFAVVDTRILHQYSEEEASSRYDDGIACYLLVTALFIFGFAVVDTRILHQYGEEEAAGSYIGDMLIITACSLLVAVGVFGIVGVVKNSVKMLYLSVSFHVVLITLQIMLAIYVALQRFGLEYKVTSYLREDFFRNLTGEELKTHNQYWEYLESNYQCCGLNGPEDYDVINSPISVACCPRAYRSRTGSAQKQLYRNCISVKNYYTEGCEDAILYALRDSGDCILGTASMCFWFQVVGVVLSMMVAHNLKNRVQVYKKTVKY